MRSKFNKSQLLNQIKKSLQYTRARVVKMSYQNRENKTFQLNHHNPYRGQFIEDRIETDNHPSRNDDTTTNLSHPGSFYIAMGPVIRFIQLFAVMPVTNVSSDDINRITFKWISFVTFYSLLGYFPGIFEVMIKPFTLIDKPLGVDLIATVVFFGTSMAAETFILLLARDWGNFMRAWQKLDCVFMKKPYIVRGWNLKVYVRLVSFSMIFIAFCNILIKEKQMDF